MLTWPVASLSWTGEGGKQSEVDGRQTWQPQEPGESSTNQRLQSIHRSLVQWRAEWFDFICGCFSLASDKRSRYFRRLAGHQAAVSLHNKLVWSKKMTSILLFRTEPFDPRKAVWQNLRISLLLLCSESVKTRVNQRNTVTFRSLRQPSRLRD